jgi:hypothetical protein
VKEKTEEYGLQPPTLEAITLQKYCVLLDNRPAWSDVPVIVESSTNEVKFVEVDSCTRYEAAP